MGFDNSIGSQAATDSLLSGKTAKQKARLFKASVFCPCCAELIEFTVKRAPRDKNGFVKL